MKRTTEKAVKTTTDLEQPIPSRPVSSTDELAITGESAQDRVRTIGEFKETNMPLSATELRERPTAWKPRTMHEVSEAAPTPEPPAE